jgi:polyisoprenoid-binding protein YceI
MKRSGAVGVRVVSAALILLAAQVASPATAYGQEAARYVVAPQQNEARYLVREQLARLDFPNDAVGRTGAVSGGIVVQPDGTIVAGESRFVIDMTSLESDSDRRDNYVRRNTLQTEAHPTVTFVPRRFEGLELPLAANGASRFRLMGDLTVRGITRSVTWDVTATLANRAIRGEARTSFTFAEFDITKPRVASVLSVADDIRLEYTFFLVPAEG